MYILFQELYDPRGVIFQNVYGTGTCDYWYNHGMWYINLVCFYPTKTIGIIKNHFGHCVGEYGPWYWITPYHLFRDRAAAARRRACFLNVDFVLGYFARLALYRLIGTISRLFIIFVSTYGDNSYSHDVWPIALRRILPTKKHLCGKYGHLNPLKGFLLDRSLMIG